MGVGSRGKTQAAEVIDPMVGNVVVVVVGGALSPRVSLSNLSPFEGSAFSEKVKACMAHVRKGGRTLHDGLHLLFEVQKRSMHVLCWKSRCLLGPLVWLEL